mmetsp:Transcript_15514/g.44321  ORF Transcript_15514/g.44321 Transcript_15514/m.44321 type:complete len:396 (+) Transcript_15514:93-1280(+)
MPSTRPRIDSQSEMFSSRSPCTASMKPLEDPATSACACWGDEALAEPACHGRPGAPSMAGGLAWGWPARPLPSAASSSSPAGGPPGEAVPWRSSADRHRGEIGASLAELPLCRLSTVRARLQPTGGAPTGPAPAASAPWGSGESSTAPRFGVAPAPQVAGSTSGVPISNFGHWPILSMRSCSWRSSCLIRASWTTSAALRRDRSSCSRTESSCDPATMALARKGTSLSMPLTDSTRSCAESRRLLSGAATSEAGPPPRCSPPHAVENPAASSAKPAAWAGHCSLIDRDNSSIAEYRATRSVASSRATSCNSCWTASRRARRPSTSLPGGEGSATAEAALGRLHESRAARSEAASWAQALLASSMFAVSSAMREAAMSPHALKSACISSLCWRTSS